jgi:hypothetical protein
MADVQAQFEQFDSAIRLGRFKENATLRAKRDILQQRLREKLPAVFAAHGEACPGFCFADQGSYDMDTGVKPLSGEFDIDQGLYVTIGIDAYLHLTGRSMQSGRRSWPHTWRWRHCSQTRRRTGCARGRGTPVAFWPRGSPWRGGTR